MPRRRPASGELNAEVRSELEELVRTTASGADLEEQDPKLLQRRLHVLQGVTEPSEPPRDWNAALRALKSARAAALVADVPGQSIDHWREQREAVAVMRKRLRFWLTRAVRYSRDIATQLGVENPLHPPQEQEADRVGDRARRRVSVLTDALQLVETDPHFNLEQLLRSLPKRRKRRGRRSAPWNDEARAALGLAGFDVADQTDLLRAVGLLDLRGSSRTSAKSRR